MKTYTQEEVDEMLKEHIDRNIELENYIISIQQSHSRPRMTQEDWDNLEEERQFNFEQFG